MFNFLRTGYYSPKGYPNFRFTGSYWWSGVSGSATYGRYLLTDHGTVNPLANTSRGYGFAIRCVTREG